MLDPFQIKRTQLLNENDYQAIHCGSCRLLSEIGILLECEKAIDIFQKAGAHFEEGRIKIPTFMVDEAIQKTASQIILSAQKAENRLDINFENPLTYFGTGGQALNVLHYEKGAFKSESAVTQDLIDIVRICEQLDNASFITRPVEPNVPEEEIDLKKTRIFLENTTKHINLANLIKIEKLPDIIHVVQDKSLISFIACVIVSPLKWADDTAEKFMRIVEEDIPVAISSCPQAGATAPISEVGELIQVNAEVLSAVVLANLIRPGAKVLYRGIPITSNLHLDLSPRWCQPDSIRRVALISELTHYYKIPCCGTAAVSDEKKPNPQAVSEKAISMVFEAASGAQFVNSALGMLEQVLTVCPEQYIIDDRILALIKKLYSEASKPDPRAIAKVAVGESLEMFGIPVNPGMQQELENRIEFITMKKETYDEQTVDAQVEQIGKAVLSGRSGTKFIKAARAGLRQGLLYSGELFKGQLELSGVIQQKQAILG